MFLTRYRNHVYSGLQVSMSPSYTNAVLILDPERFLERGGTYGDPPTVPPLCPPLRSSERFSSGSSGVRGTRGGSGPPSSHGSSSGPPSPRASSSSTHPGPSTTPSRRGPTPTRPTARTSAALWPEATEGGVGGSRGRRPPTRGLTPASGRPWGPGTRTGARPRAAANVPGPGPVSRGTRGRGPSATGARGRPSAGASGGTASGRGSNGSPRGPSLPGPGGRSASASVARAPRHPWPGPPVGGTRALAHASASPCATTRAASGGGVSTCASSTGAGAPSAGGPVRVHHPLGVDVALALLE